MKMTFEDIIKNVYLCNGGIINIIYDDRNMLDEFLMCVKYKLKDYNIIDIKDETNSRLSSLEDLEEIIEHKTIEGRNIIFINHDITKPKAPTYLTVNKVPYRMYKELINNKNITLVILNNYYSTTSNLSSEFQ
jgi:hypothetical protein